MYILPEKSIKCTDNKDFSYNTYLLLQDFNLILDAVDLSLLRKSQLEKRQIKT